MSNSRTNQLIEYERKEQEALAHFREYLQENKGLLSYVSRWGDGECGHLAEIMKEVLIGSGRIEATPDPKKKITSNVRKAVFERDAYRCVYCDAHKDLTVDHIHPESLGGKHSLCNFQTLCRSCNSKKGNSVEVQA